MLILTQKFGYRVENLKIEEDIEKNTKVIHYGVSKTKYMSIREVDKKILDFLN